MDGVWAQKKALSRLLLKRCRSDVGLTPADGVD